jgi:hypothetical protein
MWCANLNQVFRKNPAGINYESWVIFVRHGADTKIEKEIRRKHEEIDMILASQNVNYAEITTLQGKSEVYKKFKFKEGRHPLFFVFNKHPLNYTKKERFMVIEWGKWSEVDSLKNDLMAFVNFFTDEDFRKKIAVAKNKKMWNKVGQFFKDHGFELLALGITIASI